MPAIVCFPGKTETKALRVIARNAGSPDVQPYETYCNTRSDMLARRHSLPSPFESHNADGRALSLFTSIPPFEDMGNIDHLLLEWPPCQRRPIMNALRNAKDAINDGDLTSLKEIIVTLPSHAITFAEFDALFTPMLKDGYSASMLSLASSRGYLNMVRYLLTAGTDPDAVDDEGWTALHYACSEGQLAVVEELVLWARVRVNIRDRIGETALIKAAKEKHVMIVLLLLEHGADSKALSKSR